MRRVGGRLVETTALRQWRSIPVAVCHFGNRRFFSHRKQQRFDPHRSQQEWIQAAKAFLSQKNITEIDDLANYEETVRYFASQRLHKPSFVAAWKLIRHTSVSSDLHRIWLTGNHPRSVHMLNAVLDQWRILWENDQIALDPWAMLEHVQDAAEKTTVPLNSRSYSLVALAGRHNFKQGPELCERVLGLCDSPDTVLLSTTIDAWNKSGRKDAFRRAKKVWHKYKDKLPWRNTILYNTILQTMADSQLLSELEHASKTVRYMETCIDTDVYPTNDTFRIVLGGWMELTTRMWKTNNPKDASACLHSAIDLLLFGSTLRKDGNEVIDHSIYSMIISPVARFSYNNEDRRLAMQLFENVVSEMEVGSSTGELDEYLCRAMVILYAKSGQPDHAESLLRELELRTGNPVKRSHYYHVVTAWLESDVQDAMKHVEENLLQWIKRAQGDSTFAPDPSLIDKVIAKYGDSTSYDFEAILTTKKHQKH